MGPVSYNLILPFLGFLTYTKKQDYEIVNKKMVKSREEYFGRGAKSY